MRRIVERLLETGLVGVYLPVLALTLQLQPPGQAGPKGNEGKALSYTVEPAADGRSNRPRVTLTIQGNANGRCELVLPHVGSGGDLQGKSVPTVRAVSSGARLKDTAVAAVKELVHAPTELVTVQYEVDLASPASPDPSPSEPHFYCFGESLWVLPDWDRRQPIPITLRWKEIPHGWAICNSYGTGNVQEFHDTLERFQHGTYLAGDFRLRQFRSGNKTVTLALRGWPGFTDEAFEKFVRRLYSAEASFWEDNDFLYTWVVCYPTDAPAGNVGGEGRTNSFPVGRLELSEYMITGVTFFRVVVPH